MSHVFFPQLFVLEPGLTNTPQLSIEDLAELVKQNGSDILRVRIVAKNRDGSVMLELPNGQRFAAKLPVDAPLGGRLILQARPDGSAQLLQLTDAKGTPLPTTPPATNGNTPVPPNANNPATVVRPTLNNLLNLDTAAKDGMRVNLLPTSTRPLPAVGASVIGKVLTPPDAGQQTLQLANGAQVKIPLPPVFEVGTEVTLKMTAPQQAEIQRLQPPQPVQQAPQQPTQQSTQPQMPQTPVPQVQPQAPQTPQTPVLQQPVAQPAPQPLPQQPTAPVPTIPQAPQGQPPLPTQPTQAQVPQAPLPTSGQAAPKLPTLQLTTPAPDLLTNGKAVEVRFLAPQLPVNNQTAAPQLPRLQLPDGQFVQLRTPLALPDNSLLRVQLRPDGQLNVLAVRPPMPPTPQPTAPVPVVATVMAKGPQPETYILNFKDGVRVPVLSPQPLPIGAKVTVHILPSGHAEILDIQLPTSPQPTTNQLLKFSLRWDALQNALNMLTGKAPALAQQIIDRLPRIDEAFVPRLLQFIDGISAPNSIERTFGSDVVNMLRALGLDQMLQQDMAQLHQLQHHRSDSPESWRALFFPYWENKESDPRQGSMFWRRQKDKDDDKRDSLRFVVHLSLTHLGRVQFDALLKDKQLVMKLRLQDAVDPEFVKELKTVTQKALEDAGLDGQIGVEQVTHFSIDPLMDMIKDGSSLNVKV